MSATLRRGRSVDWSACGLTSVGFFLSIGNLEFFSRDAWQISPSHVTHRGERRTNPFVTAIQRGFSRRSGRSGVAPERAALS